MKSILRIIRQVQGELSLRQRVVADYILSYPEESAFLTSSQLAEASGASDATVIRFANRLGYRRYTELQNDLRATVRGKLSQVERLRYSDPSNHQSALMKTVARSMQTDLTGIELTLAGLKEEVLQAAVTEIASARRVYIAGTHSEYGIACYFASTLSWIRENVTLLDESHNPAFDSVSSISSEDTIVALSFPPYPVATVRFLEAADRRGASSIAITDSLLSPLAQRANHTLLIHDVKISFADNAAPVMSLLSALLSLVAEQNFEKSSASLKRMSDYWDEMQFYHRAKD